MKFRTARQTDVPAIVKMLADDPFGRLRDDYQEPLPECYYQAFETINADPNQELIVVEHEAEGVIGTLQLSYLQYLTYGGGLRAQIGAVRIRKDFRRKGIGRQLVEWAIRRAQGRGACLLQLMTDKRRQEAIRFYERLGLKASHEAMTLHFLL